MLCISEISKVQCCVRQEKGKAGEQIREPCPERAQSAGGNASGKPPYPCSDLEDAPAAASSRHTERRADLNTNQLPVSLEIVHISRGKQYKSE